MNVLIRPAKSPAEINDVRKLFHTYGASRNFDKALKDFPAELAGLPGKYAEPKGYLLLATIDQQPAGCIAYQALSPTICEMKRLYVLPEFRGHGLGKQLIEALIQAALIHKYQYMRLDTHPSMRTAQALYQSFGFSEIERYNDNPIPGIRFFEKKLT